MNIRLTVNGTQHTVDVEPRRILADVLRDDLRLTATHLGCEQGVCGACTVLVNGEAVRSCLMFAVQCDGASVRTVEGLSQPGEPGALQRAFSEEAGALASHPALGDDPEQVAGLVGSSLCRCTGYEPIRRAIVRASRELRGLPV